MKYIEAFSTEHLPRYDAHDPEEQSLFLAGGITDCGNWQAEVIKMLVNTGLVVINPRRKNWPMGDDAAAEQQIRWEHEHLQKSSMILFWFPPETLCPITLFEYGKWLVRTKPLFVGCHPRYRRLHDLQVQTMLERPNLNVFTDLEALVAEMKLSLQV
jgi:hypothetical protein